MKKLLMLLITPVILFGTESYKFAPQGSSVIPSIYTNSSTFHSAVRRNQSTVGSLLEAHGPKTVCVTNGTTKRLAFASLPSTPNPNAAFADQSMYIPGNVHRCADLYINGAMYIRSDEGDTSVLAEVITVDINDIQRGNN